MLKKIHKLKKRRDFNQVFKRSKVFKTENLRFNVAQSSHPRSKRFGFVVANSIDKRATRRNSLKRRLKKIIRDNLQNLQPGYDVIITVEKNFPYPYKSQEISQQVIEGLVKAKLLL